MDWPTTSAGRSAATPPGIGRALASIRSFCTPWGEKVPAGGMRGQPARHALCHTPTNHPALSPSPQPSPTVTRVRLLESRLVGEGATRGGAAGLAADLLHQPTRGRWGLGRPQARRGGYHADHQATWIGQPRCVPNQRHPSARTRAQGGGGADLCVCSAGPGSNENESLGSQESWIGQETDPVKIGSLRANGMRPDHVLKGHSWIAQGSSAALPWVAFQCKKSALKGLA